MIVYTAQCTHRAGTKKYTTSIINIIEDICKSEKSLLFWLSTCLLNNFSNNKIYKLIFYDKNECLKAHLKSYLLS